MSSVRAQPWQDPLLTPRHQHFWQGLINRLPVNSECPSSVGGEDYRFVVGGPVIRKISTIIKREPLRFIESTGRLDLCYINIGLRDSLYIRNTIGVAGYSHVEHR